jgi:hypothetical protein
VWAALGVLVLLVVLVAIVGAVTFGSAILGTRGDNHDG